MSDYFEPVTLVWNANTEDDFASYLLKKSSQSGGKFVVVARILAGTEEYTITDLRNGTWYFILTSVDDSGNESEASDEVSVTTTEGSYDEEAPLKPTGLTQVT